MHKTAYTLHWVFWVHSLKWELVYQICKKVSPIEVASEIFQELVNLKDAELYI